MVIKLVYEVTISENINLRRIYNQTKMENLKKDMDQVVDFALAPLKEMSKSKLEIKILKDSLTIE